MQDQLFGYFQGGGVDLWEAPGRIGGLSFLRGNYTFWLVGSRLFCWYSTEIQSKSCYGLIDGRLMLARPLMTLSRGLGNFEFKLMPKAGVLLRFVGALSNFIINNINMGILNIVPLNIGSIEMIIRWFK